MKYYEIVRLANTWPDMGEYEDVMKLLKRGWYRKALDYLIEWDFGEETLGRAIAFNEVRDSVLDEAKNDNVTYERDGYYICESHCPSGLYDAVYLVKDVTEKELAS